MAYQPNPINIKVGDSVIWTNDDSSTHTVTLKDQPGTDDDRSDDDNSELGIIEKIREELVSNIITNIRNTLSDLGAIGQASETTDICSSQQPSTSPIEFDSGIMQAGQTFKHTFYEAGTFEYYCAVHSAMVGKIVVS